MERLSLSFPRLALLARAAPANLLLCSPLQLCEHRKNLIFFLRLAILHYSGSAYFDVGIRKSLRRLLSYTNSHLFAPYPILTKFEVHIFISLSSFFFSFCSVLLFGALPLFVISLGTQIEPWIVRCGLSHPWNFQFLSPGTLAQNFCWHAWYRLWH